MNNYEKIYWLTRLDGINGLLIAIGIISIGLIIGIIINNLASADFDQFYSGEKIDARKKSRQRLTKNIRWLIPCALIGVLGSIMLPSQKEALIIIAGGKTINYFQKDTSLAKIPYQTTSIISNYLDKELKELQK